jgi:hypothetical protein
LRHLIFHVRVRFASDDGEVFSRTFEESEWVMADADHTTVNGQIVFYTPTACIERACRTFFSGLTAREQEQARKTLEIEARQGRTGVGAS